MSKLRIRRHQDAPEPTASEVAKTSSWSSGRALSGRTVTVALVLMILCGPVGVALALQAMTASSVKAAPSQAVAVLPAQEQQAGSLAIGYVSAWLDATRQDSTELAQYIDPSTMQTLSDTPWTHKDVTVASLTPGSGMVTVVVAATIQEQQASGSSVVPVWVRRYFQVVVNTPSAGGLSVLGLPAAVAAPPAANQPSLAYSTSATPDDPVGQSVMGFLGAYLAGSGDVTRFTTPGTSFQALSPAPYQSVTAVSLQTDGQPAASPADGSRIRVLATVQLSSAVDQQLTTTYALTLTARAGRWEITKIDTSPELSESAPTTPSANPAPSTTPKGN